MGRPIDVERRQERQELFLAAFMQTGVAVLAAKQSGVVANQHYRWLKEDPDYASRFAAAKVATETLAQQFRSRPGPRNGAKQGGRRGAEKARRQEAFLDALTRTGVIADAARDAGIAVSSHYQWLSSDPGYAERVERIASASTEIRRQNMAGRLSAASKARWEDPERRAAWSEYQKTTWTEERRDAQRRHAVRIAQDPAVRAKRAEASTVRWASAEARRANSERMKRLWADPDYRAKVERASRDPESRRARSEAARRQWESMTPDERTERVRKMRRAFKGGHKLTRIEAEVLAELNKRWLPYFSHMPIGDYAADILVPSLNLVIECDGAWFHAQRKDADEARDAAILELGYVTLRLSEAEITSKDWSRLDSMIERLSS